MPKWRMGQTTFRNHKVARSGYYTKAAALDCDMAIAKLSFMKKQDLS